MEGLITEVLELVGENPDREGLAKTPARVAKAYEYIFGGYDKNPKEILNDALFESGSTEMVVVRDIEFYSMCEHHILPFFGRVHVAYIPNGKVVGLSKIPRVVDIFARRLQIQEKLTEQIADALMETINPKGVGVVISARHMCMEMRGVEKMHSSTTTSALRGIFMKEAKTREEFYSIINTSGGNRF
ncbi:MAG TPA: GTP cyclohydrolase I FolE [Campylobacterales bacterium]|nr:GTP cyclohydrolase I FolE [Campylobacterales bacterium]